MDEQTSVIIYFSNGKSVRDRFDNIIPVHMADINTSDFLDLLRSGKNVVNLDNVSFAHRWKNPDEDDM